MALGRTCKTKGNSLPCFILKKFREVPYQSMQFYSDSSHLKSHNNLDQEIKLMLPLKLDFSGTTYVPTSSSTRRVNSCIRGTLQSMDRATIHHLHDKSLHGFPHICVGSFIQSMKHFYCVLFFCFYFIFLFFLIFERLNIYFF